MNEQPEDEVFARSTEWAIDQQMVDRKSIRVAWSIAFVSMALAVLAIVAIIVLLPLKREEPIALLVDKTTGYVQRVDPSEGNVIRADEALIQSLLAQYVIAREGFDRASIGADYRKTALWSSGTARSAYQGIFASSSTQNPLSQYAQGDLVRVSVKSVTMLEDGSAFVRFDTQLTRGIGRVVQNESWISLVRYRFIDAQMSYEDRLLNPLGLQVYSYRRDAERPQQAVPSGLSEPGDVQNDRTFSIGAQSQPREAEEDAD